MANGENSNETTTPIRVVVDILKPETCPPALRKYYNEDERKAIQAAIQKEQIEFQEKVVTVRSKTAGVKDETWPYIQYRAVKGPGMSALCRGRMDAKVELPEDYDKLDAKAKERADIAAKDGACDFFNYGFSLSLMAPIRTMLANSLGGVDKEIEKQIAQVLKTGLFTSEEAAKDFVMSQREKLRMEVQPIEG